MNEHPPPVDQYAPGWAYPDPAAADGPTPWGAPVRDAVESADGAAPWSDVIEPAAVPPPVAGAEGPHTRPGWLTASRGDGPPDAA